MGMPDVDKKQEAGRDPEPVSPEPKGLGSQLQRKRILVILLIILVLLAVLAGFFLWKREMQKPVHRTLHHTAEIRTDDYWLELPEDWANEAEVEIRPMNETYGGRDPDGQRRIPEENYQLIVYMKREGDKKRVQLASIEMYTYLEDCQQLDDWEFIGKLSVSPQGKDLNFSYPFLIIHYAKAPEDLSSEEAEQFAAMKEELAASVKNLNVDKPQELSERKKKKNEEALYVRFEPNQNGKKKQGQNWEERYREEARYERQMEMLQRQQEAEKKKREEKEAAEAEAQRKQYEAWEKSRKQKKSAGASASGRKDDYYKDDFDAFWDDNAEDYDDEDEAYEDWEDEYGEED